MVACDGGERGGEGDEVYVYAACGSIVTDAPSSIDMLRPVMKRLRNHRNHILNLFLQAKRWSGRKV